MPAAKPCSADAQQCALRWSFEDSVELVYHVGLIDKAASIDNISPGRSMGPLDQDLLDPCTTRKLLGGLPQIRYETSARVAARLRSGPRQAG